MNLPELPAGVVEEAVERALREDLGRAGDITTDATIAADSVSRAAIRARDAGVVAGVGLASAVLAAVDANIVVHVQARDGSQVRAGDTVMRLEGATRGILSAERTALNFLSHLSGIATAAANLVDAVAGTGAAITCTRKTTPGLRLLEKYAVRCGGAQNHRFGLYDAVLIKDNHIAASGGIAAALEAVRRAVGSETRVEIEVDSLAQFAQVLECPVRVDVVMLDNMDVSDLRRAVRINRGRVELEASGKVTPANVRAIAKTGVDFISSGWITHSAPILDLAMDFCIDESGPCLEKQP